MQLTKRFFTMNVLSVILSVGLTVLAVIIFVAVYTKIFSHGVDSDELKHAFEVRTGLNEINMNAQTMKFEQLLDNTYKQELSARVRALGAHAVIFKEGEIVYSAQNVDDIDIERILDLSSNMSDQDTVELNGKIYIFARTNYTLEFGDSGVLLLFAQVKLKADLYMLIGYFTIGVFVLFFLLMNFWVSCTFSRGIIFPVVRLKDAAVKISEGDLDGEIVEEGEGEVRELCRTLELMRIKLKESVYLQQKYDDDRKFLVSSISHDLKTPVTSVIGYIGGIIDGVAKTPEKTEEYLETARSKAILVNAMIDDLLLYSKLDLNHIPYHFEKIDLVAYFEDCVVDYQYEYNKANLSLELDNQLNHSVLVFMDRERFKRVVQNILDNAAAYIDKPKGKVAIVLRETTSSAIIEIKDNGKGIPEAKLPHIFDRFYRADSSRSHTNGSGLGLAIAKQIVEGHEGDIWARSVVDEGTRIMISLKKI
ncbi:sensor histidine kinase [Paenibacillus sp. 481]|uniref:sensor histidine kinase n=1 Tax=Paenibacillus sp. 481 TaxID=2835869 RepID=UPI001E4A7740|nr:HAMP domain-containing sensor histidine kinase [Paenibacillus sp. 481]UHA75153.1 HAMP domain-containing histidine kinase [Paenibacillus sp. 481]